MRFANCVFKKNLVEMEGNLFLFYGYDTPQNKLKNSQKRKKKKLSFFGLTNTILSFNLYI